MEVNASSLSLLAHSSPRDVATDPFPHLVVQQPVPEVRYGELVDRLPSPEVILHGRRSTRNNSAARLPFFLTVGNDAVDPAWQAFFTYHVSRAFWLDIVSVFGGAIRSRYPNLESAVGRTLEEWRVAPRGEHTRLGHDADVELDCQFVVNTPVREISAVRTAHLDAQDTLFSGLFYLREPEDTVSGSDLQLARWRRRPRFLESRMIIPRDVDIVKTIPYGANVFACFVNSVDSVHAVTPRGVTPLFRRYINLIAKVRPNLFDVPLAGKLTRCLHMRDLKSVRESFLQGDRIGQLPPGGAPAQASARRGE